MFSVCFYQDYAKTTKANFMKASTEAERVPSKSSLNVEIFLSLSFRHWSWQRMCPPVALLIFLRHDVFTKGLIG